MSYLSTFDMKYYIYQGPNVVCKSLGWWYIYIFLKHITYFYNKSVPQIMPFTHLYIHIIKYKISNIQIQKVTK